MDKAAGTANEGSVPDAILKVLECGGVRRVLDLGCGDGALAAVLVRRGHSVTGIDPNDRMIAKARRRVPAAEFICAGAEQIAAPDLGFGAAIFLNSLHHIPAPLMGRALDQALRVLRHEGLLIVVEPLARGTFFQAMRPLDDETAIRATALDALAAFEARSGCLVIQEQMVDRVSRFHSLAAFEKSLCDADPARACAIEERTDEISAAFYKAAEVQDGAFILRQPHMLRILRKT